jgi:putative membrane protein
MTCCADDIQFIGFLCRSGNIAVPKPGEWVTVTARMQYEYRREYRGIGPVLLAEDVQPAERPADELVYFN